MTVIAETYPAEALRHLGLKLAGSKRRLADRVALAGGLRAAMARLGALPDAAMAAAVADGFGTDAAGEDRFDCTLGVLCAMNVLAGRRPPSCPTTPGSGTGRAGCWARPRPVSGQDFERRPRQRLNAEADAGLVRRIGGIVQLVRPPGAPEPMRN